jgi:hypothetical protein
LYTLYNTKLKKPLVHPQVGVWASPTLAEAEELLAACHEYVRAIGHEELVADLVVRTISEVDKS